MRIGIGGLSCECCTFSPLISTRSDFSVFRGGALLARYDFLADYPEVEFVPLLWARALPGGCIERRFYDAIKSELLAALRQAGPLDGLFLHMHGASSVVGLDDAEGDLIASIREAAGAGCLISASYDLHGNVSPGVMQHLDLLTAYRTAPHTDWQETIRRACSLLVKCLREKRIPRRAFIPVPILLSGEQTSTDWQPGAGLYARIPEVMAEFGLLDASLLIGYAWADEPRSTAAVVALGFDPEPLGQAAEKLARLFWEARSSFRFGSPAGSVDACIRQALESPERPVVISDSGDNPTAGGAGDVPYMLGRLLALNVPDAVYASLADPAAVDACVQGGIDGTVELRLGGKLDPVHGVPLGVRGEVVAIRETPLPEGAGESGTNTVAVVRVGGVTALITQRRTPFHHLDDFLRLGIDPRRHAMLVVKIGYLVPELKRIAARSLLALSPGAVGQDLVHLPFQRIRRPLFPFDPDMEWDPAGEVKILCRR
jgi:microcystin degradation protein MlrC